MFEVFAFPAALGHCTGGWGGGRRALHDLEYNLVLPTLSERNHNGERSQDFTAGGTQTMQSCIHRSHVVELRGTQSMAVRGPGGSAAFPVSAPIPTLPT